MTDIYDGAPLTEMHVDDLGAAIDHGCSVEDVAEFLYPSGTDDEVERTRKELRL
jgi:hypothetical protein